MLISYDLLQTLLQIGSSPTFAVAAAKLQLTPSAVSHQMRQLESQVGFPIFERVGRKSKLTRQGALMLDAVRQHFPALDEALARLVDEPHKVRGPVSLAGPMPFARVWLRPRLAGLVHSYPHLELEVRFGVPSVLLRHLLDGSIDLAILSEQSDSALVESVPIFTETFVAVCSPRYERGRSSLASADDTADWSFIVFNDTLPMHAAWWHAAFGRVPMQGRVACRVANLDEMLFLAEQGLGVAVLPDYLVAGALGDGRLLAINVDTARAARFGPPQNALHLAWRRGRAETARVQAVRAALLAKPGAHIPVDV